MRSIQKIAAGVAALLLLGGGASAALAQQAERPAFLSAGGVEGQADLDIWRENSAFNLRAQGDEAAAGVRSNGQNSNCVTNLGFSPGFTQGCDWGAQVTRTPVGNLQWMYFGLSFGLAAPPSDLPSVIDPVASGLKGGGYTVNATLTTVGVQGGSDKIWASDRSGAELLAFGVRSTDDASCTNFEPRRSGGMEAGYQLLPVSTCPPTIPPTGWMGRRPIEEEAWLEVMDDPDFQDDPFAFWRVPEELQRTDKTFGDWQTYGEWNDYYFQALERYGAVIPGQSGAPVYSGWPTGVEVFFDAFYFGLPTVGGATYWQATLANNSEEVYGVPVDYDSLYFIIHYQPGNRQRAAHYFDPSRSALLWNNTGNDCVGKRAPPAGGCYQIEMDGFRYGAAGLVVLKSPLGDQRFKMLSDPESPFYTPGHARAGDTITFNHQHQCGYGGCYPNTMGRSQRAMFGLFSSQGKHVLDGRSPGDLAAGDYWLTFRSQDWPERTGEFNKYVPGVDDDQPIWDYNHDGVADTIYADACGREGCVDLWGDTLPGSFYNAYGNVSAAAIGPFALKAGDTTAVVMAVVGAPDAAGMNATVNNSIDFYQRFFLGPESAPAPNIIAVDVVGGSTRDAEVTLFFDDASEEWVDPFLASLDVSADAPLNEFLEDTVASLVNNNVAALHIFRSCDGGSTFSSDADCDADPVTDATSKWSGFGWEPYATLEATASGGLPNTFKDQNVTSGITYTYVIITETRGAEFNLVRASGSGFVAETVTFAPSLLGALSAATTNPNVASVYIPLSLATGASRAEVQVTRSGLADVPVNISLIGTATRGGTYRAIFVDSVVVRQVETIVDGSVTSTETTVSGYLLRTSTEDERVIIQQFEFTRAGSVVTSGLEETDSQTDANQRVTTFEGEAGLILVDAQNMPLLVSTTLTGAATTPGTFLGDPNFPFFTLDVDRSAGGDFAGQFYLRPSGDTIPTSVRPTIEALRTSNATVALDPSQFGTYAITYADEVFGPNAPFRVNERVNLQASVTQSLEARQDASTSVATEEAVEAVLAADPSATIEVGEVQVYNLPFTVRNATYNRDVQVLVAQHSDSILLGQGFDSVRVAVPEGEWVPGDVLYFLEQVTREVTDDEGRTVIVNGQPQTESVLVATSKVTLGCSSPRASCDPTIGGRTGSGYNPVQPGVVQMVRWLVPFSGGEEVTFTVTPARAPADVAAVTGDMLRNVHVVPNPYVFSSQYERATTDRVIKFTSLPPEGRIRIFDVAGRFIQEINYTAEDLMGGDLSWDLSTREGLELAYGLYVFVLQTPTGEQAQGKFVVIR